MTLDRRPSVCKRRHASFHSGKSLASCSQCTSAASSHHSRSLRIATRCGPASMKFFIEPSSAHAVAVQKARLRSFKICVAKFPGALEACRADRSEYQINCGRKRQERTRRRVIEVSGMLSASVHDPCARRSIIRVCRSRAQGIRPASACFRGRRRAWRSLQPRTVASPRRA